MAKIVSTTVFATGAAGSSGLDSLAYGDGSLWAEYGNGADSTGAAGASTIVRYSTTGTVQHTYTVAGSADGLKVDPATGFVWVLQNQDGNSTLSLLDPATDTLSAAQSYAVGSDSRGYDDVAFAGGKVYMSYTNPAAAGDAVVQQLSQGHVPAGPLTLTTILAAGATGYDIGTGQADQPIPLSDPDSLKSTPGGGLVLSSGDDNTFVLISHPGEADQSERFVTLTGLPAGSALDDVVLPTSSSGTFYVANPGTGQLEAIKVSGLNTADAYASVGTEIVQVDLQTGTQTVLVAGLSKSHGLIFVPTPAHAPVVQSEKIFAVGAEVGATRPDSITLGGGSVWVEYGNGADSTGLVPHGGNSTIVQYDMIGRVEHTYKLPGSLDGLKYDRSTGQVWALRNQDGNSKLYLIDPRSHSISAPFSYGSGYVYGANSTRGYDDVAFSHGRVFLSYTNPDPMHVGDAVVQELDAGHHPSGKLETTAILRYGDTGTNLVTGQVNQVLPVNDPDSLKALADGSLILTSDHDHSLTIIHDPGQATQTASFITLPAGTSGLDDAIMPTSTSGTFIIANQGANDVLKVAVTGLNTSDIYLSLGSENAIVQIDLRTGDIVPVITGLNSPHGMEFIASPTPAATGNPLSAHVAEAAASLAEGYATPVVVPIAAVLHREDGHGPLALAVPHDTVVAAPALLAHHA